ncbi:hypothetical protein GCM10019017_77680 [Streptomyces showdoensis]
MRPYLRPARRRQGIGTTTAYRYVTEAVELLAELAPDLTTAMKTATQKAFVILDGTLLPIDRIAADRPCYSGKHKRHGMNVQVLADPHGRLLRPSIAPTHASGSWASCMATLKTWRFLRKLRCSTIRITNIVRAALTPHQTCSK